MTYLFESLWDELRRLTGKVFIIILSSLPLVCGFFAIIMFPSLWFASSVLSSVFGLWLRSHWDPIHPPLSTPHCHLCTFLPPLGQAVLDSQADTPAGDRCPGDTCHV